MYEVKVDSKFQYGQKNASGEARFLVLHDKDRKPYQVLLSALLVNSRAILTTLISTASWRLRFCLSWQAWPSRLPTSRDITSLLWILRRTTEATSSETISTTSECSSLVKLRPPYQQFSTSTFTVLISLKLQWNYVIPSFRQLASSSMGISGEY